MLLPLLLQRASPYLDQARLWWQVHSFTRLLSNERRAWLPPWPAATFIATCCSAFAMPELLRHAAALLTGLLPYRLAQRAASSTSARSRTSRRTGGTSATRTRPPITCCSRWSLHCFADVVGVCCKPLSRRLTLFTVTQDTHRPTNVLAYLQAIIAYLGTFPDLCAQYATASLALGKVRMVHACRSTLRVPC